jgi:hypothetical protein
LSSAIPISLDLVTRLTLAGFWACAKQGKVQRAVVNYIDDYLDEGDRDYLQKKKYKIKYLDYDCSLNQQ